MIIANNLERPEITLYKMPCRIIKDDIYFIPTDPRKLKIFYPFDYYECQNEPSLYLQFISIDETNLKQISDFINRFGYIEEYTIDENDPVREKIRLLIDTAINMGKTEFDSEAQALILQLSRCSYNDLLNIPLKNKYQSYILQMRSIAKLWKSQNNDEIIEALTDMVNYGVQITPPFCLSNVLKLDIGKAAFDENKYSILSMVFDWMLKNTNTVLKWDSVNKKFYSSWKCNDLLTVMYVMMFMDVTNNKVIRKCENDTCGKFFEVKGNYKDKIYCDNKCARAQAQREYRKRIKTDKESE